MTVYLLRHGETEYNTQRRYLGRTDPPLSPKGRAALVPGDFSPGIVYVSPLRRAVETAGLLFPDAEAEAVPGLREMDFGIFEGRSAAEMSGDPAYRQWVDGFCQGPVPGGESKDSFSRRTCRAFAALLTAARTALPSWPTAAPRWRRWSGTPCPGGITTPGRAPMAAGLCWTPPAGQRTGP